ncbi:flagellar hook-associated protein FlgK [Pelagibacterium montanilacus]|uniref:flagellar hook-associated protein FlgK n=1 Tax=Pelagibacterium montanilacus TaxID=2185280 RepID=UPI000F8F08F5|nr:flagellar hook-associated protein FlgK [Pelagibacterium montanilacus]
MGLSSTLSNALAGMNASQRGIDVLSRNVANAGTPGYHRQSQTVTDTSFGTSAQVRLAGLERAFNDALQKQHVSAVSSASFHATRATFLDRLQMHMGMPGDAHSLDTLYAGFENALQSLATNPDDHSARAGVIGAAQMLVEQLNSLSTSVRDLEREAGNQMSDAVAGLNRQVDQLAAINLRILDQSQDEGARLALMDERDRLVAGISEAIDVKVTYRGDGTVALMTESGIGILDVKPSEFRFETDGRLELATPSGLRLDMSTEGLLKSGRLAALADMRGTTLPAVQAQFDEIAAGLALAMNTVEVGGTAIAPDPGIPGDPGGFSFDASAIAPGNSLLVAYRDGAGTHAVRFVHTEDGATLQSPNTAGETVVGIDFTDDAAAQAAIAAELGSGFTVTVSGGALTVLDDGTGANGVDAMTGRMTGTGLGLDLFIDSNGRAYSGSLDGAGQKAGFAGRITVNGALASDPTALVQHAPGVSMGDAARPEFLLQSIKSAQFIADAAAPQRDGGTRLTGTVREMIAQSINHQGDTAARAQSQAEAFSYRLDAINTRMESEYGVNVDEEMARLMELQNAYSASARVVSTVQELLDALLRM